MANQYIPSSELSFEAYKNSLKDFLRSQKRFKDYDFEGSNLSVLIDLLALNTYNNAHYSNMIGSEAGFIDTAQLRESKVSHAKSLNYTPRSRISARANINIEITPADAPSSITIPKYYAFKASDANASLRFITDQNIILTPDAQGRYRASDITIYEGEVVTERFLATAPNVEDGITTYDQIFDLQSSNIDVTSIEVVVKSNESDPTPVKKTRVQNLYGLDSESDIFFVRGYKDTQYRIEFGDGIFGRALVAGNVIEVRYRDTIGNEGNGTYVFSRTTPIDGYSSITTVTTTRAAGGAERESAESIEYNATRHFQVQERATIDMDFEVLVTENFPEIQAVSAYSGDLVGHYGEVFIVLKPRDPSNLVPNYLKTRIIEFIKTKTLVPEPSIEDADFYYVWITGTVSYLKDTTFDRKSEIEADAIDAILKLNDGKLGSFNVSVDQDTIIDPIKDSHSSISGVSLDLNLVRRWAPITGTRETLTFTCQNEIKSATNGAYLNSAQAGVKSSTFQTIYNDRLIDAIVADNGIGTLFLYEIAAGSSAPLKTGLAVGTVNYAEGTVDLSLDVTSYVGQINIYLTLVENNISVSRNRWLSVDTPYIDLEVIPK